MVTFLPFRWDINSWGLIRGAGRDSGMVVGGGVVFAPRAVATATEGHSLQARLVGQITTHEIDEG